MRIRFDPGPCPICGAEHTACTAASGPIVVALAPMRDALAVVAAPPPLRAEQVQAALPPGQTTSGTYRGNRRR